MEIYLEGKKASDNELNLNNQSLKQERSRLLSSSPTSGILYQNYTNQVQSETFFKFQKVSRNTRKRLVLTNKDLFIIWGHNWIISLVFVTSYLAVWCFGLGKSKSKIVRTLV